LSLRELIVELIAWAPLIVLLLSSLGLIILKRISGLPPWVQRLTVPPFYLVSLSIAILIVGIEVLAFPIYVLVAFSLHHDWQAGIFLGVVFFVIRVCGEFPFELLRYPGRFFTDMATLVAFCAAQFVSGRLLWRTLWRDDGREYPSSKTLQHLGALLLFAWVFLKVALVGFHQSGIE
jgi:hypothetical protein